MGINTRGVMVGAVRVTPAVTRLTVYRWPQVSMAGRAFKHDFLRIVLADFDEGQEKPSLDVILAASDSPMSIEMLCTEPS